MTYGALCTKVRALYGNRLRFADFEQLSTQRSVGELLDYLGQHPGWSRAVAQLGSDVPYIGRIELEGALREELRLEYLSLQHFVPRKDKPIMQFRIRMAEQEAILNSLRRLHTGKYAKGMPPAPRSVLQGCIDYPALRAAASYDDVLAAARRSIYHPVLLHLRPAPGAPPPDYTVVECLMESTYFAHMFRLIDRQYQGTAQGVLREAFGQQVDLMNLIHILRLKTYFPDTAQERYLTALYPFNYKLSPQLTRDLCAAPDLPSAMSLIAQTTYARHFDGVAAEAVEDYYRRALYVFNRRQLMTGAPSIYVAMAYLSMKESELRVLINVIESVKYGVPYDAELARLVGT